MDNNLFGEPYEQGLHKVVTADEKKKRRWENAFQKWSDKHGMDGHTHYGACGFGAICNFCIDNTYGRPCVRALNKRLREKRQNYPDYNILSDKAFEAAFDGKSPTKEET